MALNVELLEKVKVHILEEPARFVMSRWQLTATPGTMVHLPKAEIQQRRKVPACGTMACVAGWTVILGGGNTHFNVQGQAVELLDSPEAARKLFHIQKWSPYFQRLWNSTKSPRKHAQIAAKVIDQFIRKEVGR